MLGGEGGKVWKLGECSQGWTFYRYPEYDRTIKTEKIVTLYLELKI